MMIGETIVLTISEEEASVIIQALCIYQGPFPDNENLTYPGDIEHRDRKLSIRDDMYEKLAGYLQDIYSSRGH
jgi:hypothetical protein